MNPGIFFTGVGNHYLRNEIAHAPHQAIMGGGSQALCGACHWLPKLPVCDEASDQRWGLWGEVCSSNDNIIEGNYIHVR